MGSINVARKGGSSDQTARLSVKGGKGADGRAATVGGIVNTPIMSAKKRKQILDLRRKSEQKKKLFLDKMKLAIVR